MKTKSNSTVTESRTDTQKAMIKSALDAGAILDPSWAWNKVGCSKLSTRIGEMERDGIIPKVHRYDKSVNGKNFTIYSRKPLKQYENKGKK